MTRDITIAEIAHLICGQSVRVIDATRTVGSNPPENVVVYEGLGEDIPKRYLERDMVLLSTIKDILEICIY